MIITGKKFSKPAMSRVKNGDIVLPETKNLEQRQRLDLYLVEHIPDYNRSTLQNFIKSGYVKIDGQLIQKPNAEIVIANENGKLAHKIDLNIPKKPLPPDLDQLRVYEDDNVLVLNKPAGLLSMKKGEFSPESTLEDYGLLVHRLDRDTSGIVILAKNEATRSMLRRQFQERKTHKTYNAVTEGCPKNPEALIDLPIARNLKRPTTFKVDPNGKSAQTYYKVLKTTPATASHGPRALLELRPVTGRTHQLRVHLKYLGCPILGDRVYGLKSATESSAAPRLFLHAKSLEITIPGSPENQRKTFTAPLPPEFEAYVS